MSPHPERTDPGRADAGTPPDARSPRVMWVLRGQADGTPEVTFRLLAGSIRTLGRAVRADFSVEAPMVSRFHCRLSAAPTGELVVEDLGSTNGTFVNGRRVDHAVLADGDRLGIGRLELLVSTAPVG